MKTGLSLAMGTAALLAATTAGAQEPISVAAIYTVPVEQQWVSRLHKAFQEAEARGEISYQWAENVAQTDNERVTREYAEAGVDLIVGEAFSWERAARSVAGDYPETAFLFGSSFGPSGENFAVFDNWIHEPSYLSGLIAGSLTESNKIGMVGGYPIPEVNRLMHAFLDGACATNPEIEYLVTFIGSWYDPPKAKEAAFAMVDSGADLLYAERYGVSDAAQERGVLSIGNVIDTQGEYPGTVVASALWHFEPTADRAIAAVAGGTFEPSDYGQYSYMAYGGGSIVFDESLVDAEVATQMQAVEQDILDGLFRVNVNDSAPKSGTCADRG